ncbi:MAG: hypothetical protein JOZ93_08180, partial [Sinobacteraceae bacterium]|nr:hypothetical protein [Nevskiaceae bacterium]
MPLAVVAILSGTNSYQIIQRDTTSGDPAGGTTSYGKGWAGVTFTVTSDTSGDASFRIRDAQDPSHVIQGWTSTGQTLQAGQATAIKTEIPASTNGYIVDVAPSANLA